jgi:hypothetical protein
MSRDVSDRWPDADETAAIGGAVSELYADGSFITCPDCKGDLRYQNKEVVVCVDCETQFSHIYTSNGTNKLYRAPDTERAATTYDPADDDGKRVLADGSGEIEPGFHALAVRIERDDKVVAAGALLPSGAVAVEWNREAFPEGERTEHPTTSLYGHIDDAEEASGGTVAVDHYREGSA